MGVSKKLGVVAAVCLAMVLGAVPPTASAAWNTVQFVGSGWGHGVGLSQYGAFALGIRGYSYSEILAHYYQGTSNPANTKISGSTKIWVNLENDFTSRSLQVLNVGSTQGASVQITGGANGPISARPGASIAIAKVAGTGCAVTVTNPDQTQVSAVDDTWCTIDFKWYNWADASVAPTTKLQIQGCTARGLPCQYARGMFHLRHDGAALDLSAEMLMNHYVLGLSEMPVSWPLETLKAQAVAARSYAENRRVARGNPTQDDNNDCWCHVWDTTVDQAYVGWGHPVGNWVDAANATANQVLTHPSAPGVAIAAYYSSSSGGATEFGHLKGFSTKPVPWLTSVYDKWAVDGTVSNPNASWTVEVGAQTVAGKVGLDVLWSTKVSSRRQGSNSAAQVQFSGSLNGEPTTVTKTGSWVRQNFGLKSEYFNVIFNPDAPGDEMLMYKTNGTFRYMDVNPNGTMGSPILGGTGYTTGWDSITAVDLDGDGQDEMLFYRDDGLFRFYEIGSDGHLGHPILAGTGYTPGWDSITAVDLNGDGQDELFFYRDDGLFRFYDVHASGHLGSPILQGSGYTKGWDSITAVDMNGDGEDELFFYRSDGLYRYYNVRPDGYVGSPIAAGSGYTTNWSSIRAVDINGDGDDEMFFYRTDGLYRFYSVSQFGALSSPITAGTNFGQNWDVIAAVNLDGR
ncbi:MAG TPA: FG-GAP-like repeat-containing protein [Acidimicrobiia bacterium]|nr:FG-GAP-like repeat-containing protein [Acidimicrobiia bacterium]